MGDCLFMYRGAPPSVEPPKGKILDGYSWKEISYISSNGLIGEYGFQVGDAKAITLNGTVGSLTLDNYQTYAYIIGINHNAELEGDNLIHFQLAKAALSAGREISFVDNEYLHVGSSVAFRMNTSNTNSGGWEESYMRNTICGTDKANTSDNMMGVIPNDLLGVLKTVNKYTNNVGESTAESAVTSTADYFFLLSEYEVFGSIGYANEYEADYQQQYAYYSAGNSTVKVRYIPPPVPTFWGLRSPAFSDNRLWLSVSLTGEVDSLNASASFGFAPCFCV